MASGIEEPRQLRSGRWQARYTTPEGERRSLGTFRSKSEAYQAVIPVAADIGRGTWHDPRKGQRRFSEYATEVHEQRKATLTRPPGRTSPHSSGGTFSQRSGTGTSGTSRGHRCAPGGPRRPTCQSLGATRSSSSA